MAQALVRVPALAQQVERDGASGAALRRRARHLRPRQRRRRRPGAAAARRRCATYCPETSRRWCTPPSAYAPPPQPAADVGVHLVDRPRRDQHGHRRGAGHGQPAAGAAPARRRLRHPAGRARPCSSWSIPAAPDASVNDAFRPVSRFFDRINRPDQLQRVAARGDAGADRPGRDRRGHPRAAPGRPGRGVRLSRRSSSSRGCGGSPGPPPTPTAVRAAAELVRAARRAR